MVNVPRYLPDLFIAAALLVLCVMLVIPWPLSEPSAVPSSETGVASTTAAGADTDRRKSDARTVAGLFGYRAPAPRTPLPRLSTAPVDDTASWIKYMGYITDENGQSKYFFKNTRSGQVLNLFLGRDNGQGWKLTSITGAVYIIENKGIVYKVPK